MWKADKAERPSGIPFARNSPWAIVRGRFDKLPNNCQMLENNKVGADTRKNRARDSVNEPARLLASVLNVCTNGCSNTPMTPLRASSWFPRSRRFERVDVPAFRSALCYVSWRVRTWTFWKFRFKCTFRRENIERFIFQRIIRFLELFPQIQFRSCCKNFSSRNIW